MTASRVLRPRAAAAYLALSRSTLWRLAQRDPDFPKPISLSGPAAVGFLVSELDGWLERRANARPPRRTAEAGASKASTTISNT